MTDEKPKAKRTKKPLVESVYTNTGKANIFTSRGRVVPGGEITLLESEAKVSIKLVQGRA
tara:strand:+ start:1019 stop:1198 length:180 start_codon:yes stop_codon:yes gene_type:complete